MIQHLSICGVKPVVNLVYKVLRGKVWKREVGNLDDMSCCIDTLECISYLISFSFLQLTKTSLHFACEAGSI